MKIHYTNFRKLYPQTKAFSTRWFHFNRFWGGKLITIGFLWHVLKIDLRKDWVKDMKDFGERNR